MISEEDWRYYEAHLTTEPVFDQDLVLFKKICLDHKFHVAELLMQRRKTDSPDRSKNDAFCTSRSKSYHDIKTRAISLAKDLDAAGFVVWRYKIEFTLLDSRYDDSVLKLERALLPEKETSPRPSVS